MSTAIQVFDGDGKKERPPSVRLTRLEEIAILALIKLAVGLGKPENWRIGQHAPKPDDVRDAIFFVRNSIARLAIARGRGDMEALLNDFNEFKAGTRLWDLGFKASATEHLPKAYNFLAGATGGYETDHAWGHDI